MKKHHLLICMLSTTLALPSIPTTHANAETVKHISESSQSEEAPSTTTTPSSNKKQKRAETPKTTFKNKDIPRTGKEERRNEDTFDASHYLNDHFFNNFDFFNPSPVKSLSVSNMWQDWFSSDNHASTTYQPSIGKTSSDGETSPNTTDSTQVATQSTPSAQEDAQTSAETPSTEATSSRDNSHLSESDKAIADELDNISASIGSSSAQTSAQHTETPHPASHETSSSDDASDRSKTQQQSSNHETTTTRENDSEKTEGTSNETPSSTDTETHQPSSDEKTSVTNSDDPVIDAVLDQYSQKSKSETSRYKNQKNHLPAQSDKPNTKQPTNPQLPSKTEFQTRETPKQSFEGGFKNANLRSTATFETLPGLSDSASSHDFVITENKNTRDFIKKIAKDAHDIGQKNDIYASVMIAQAILESDSGNSMLARAPHYNLFGIKGAYQGQSTTFNTLEDSGGNMYQISAQFRSYPNQKASLQDYSDLMKHGIDGHPDIYKPAWKSEAATYRSATEHLSTTYATDSYYADKLNSIIQHYHLTQFDKKHMPDLTSYTASPNEDTSDFKPFIETNGTSPYPHGQCTWYVYQRMAQYGLHIGGNLGDARNWDTRAEEDGYDISMTPITHSAVIFEAGQQGADSVYGHVAFVEKINKDGSIVISESNVKGLGVISYRTIDAHDAQDLTYIKGKH